MGKVYDRHCTTKVTKSTKLRNSKISIPESFVYFVRFVVKNDICLFDSDYGHTLIQGGYSNDSCIRSIEPV
jgi:hypothetical protein